MGVLERYALDEDEFEFAARKEKRLECMRGVSGIVLLEDLPGVFDEDKFKFAARKERKGKKNKKGWYG